MIVTMIQLKRILTDGGTQQRTRTREDVIDDYAEHRKAGCIFPPVIVFRDRQGRIWLASGFHRFGAEKKAFGLNASIACDVRDGELRDAILFSCCCNREHGLRREPEDKRKAVLTLLLDEEWGQWSNREIARQCAVGEHLVRVCRGAIAPGTQSEGVKVERRDGTTYSYPPRKQEQPRRLEEMTSQERADAINTAELAALRPRAIEESCDRLTEVLSRLEPYPELVEARRLAEQALALLAPLRPARKAKRGRAA